MKHLKWTFILIFTFLSHQSFALSLDSQNSMDFHLLSPGDQMYSNGFSGEDNSPYSFSMGAGFGSMDLYMPYQRNYFNEVRMKDGNQEFDYVNSKKYQNEMKQLNGDMKQLKLHCDSKHEFFISLDNMEAISRISKVGLRTYCDRYQNTKAFCTCVSDLSTYDKLKDKQLKSMIEFIKKEDLKQEVMNVTDEFIKHSRNSIWHMHSGLGKGVGTSAQEFKEAYQCNNATALIGKIKQEEGSQCDDEALEKIEQIHIYNDNGCRLEANCKRNYFATKSLGKNGFGKHLGNLATNAHIVGDGGNIAEGSTFNKSIEVINAESLKVIGSHFLTYFKEVEAKGEKAAKLSHKTINAKHKRKAFKDLMKGLPFVDMKKHFPNNNNPSYYEMLDKFKPQMEDFFAEHIPNLEKWEGQKQEDFNFSLAKFMNKELLAKVGAGCASLKKNIKKLCKKIKEKNHYSLDIDINDIENLSIIRNKYISEKGPLRAKNQDDMKFAFDQFYCSRNADLPFQFMEGKELFNSIVLNTPDGNEKGDYYLRDDSPYFTSLSNDQMNLEGIAMDIKEANSEAPTEAPEESIADNDKADHNKGCSRGSKYNMRSGSSGLFYAPRGYKACSASTQSETPYDPKMDGSRPSASSTSTGSVSSHGPSKEDREKAKSALQNLVNNYEQKETDKLLASTSVNENSAIEEKTFFGKMKDKIFGDEESPVESTTNVPTTADSATESKSMFDGFTTTLSNQSKLASKAIGQPNVKQGSLDLGAQGIPTNSAIDEKRKKLEDQVQNLEERLQNSESQSSSVATSSPNKSEKSDKNEPSTKESLDPLLKQQIADLKAELKSTKEELADMTASDLDNAEVQDQTVDQINQNYIPSSPTQALSASPGARTESTSSQSSAQSAATTPQSGSPSASFSAPSNSSQGSNAISQGSNSGSSSLSGSNQQALSLTSFSNSQVYKGATPLSNKMSQTNLAEVYAQYASGVIRTEDENGEVIYQKIEKDDETGILKLITLDAPEATEQDVKVAKKEAPPVKETKRAPASSRERYGVDQFNSIIQEGTSN